MVRRDPVHLLLGHPQDPCCLSVLNLLKARNYPARIIANPMAHPSRFAWRLNNAESTSQLAWDEEQPIADDEIAGVLVRGTGWIEPAGWEPADLAYMQAETQAALLAWIWSLACPVVNRFPSALWYRPRVPLLSWQGLLRRCGLPTSEVLVTNVEDEARGFGRRLALEGVDDVVYGPLTSDARYLVGGDEDWRGLAALQQNAPVCLTYPHGAAQPVCVVGEQVVWEGKPSSEMTTLEPALQRFAVAAGLAFVELALAPTHQGICVIQVEPQANFAHFAEAARKRIVEGIVYLLTSEAG
jgi:hypothetical protein